MRVNSDQFNGLQDEVLFTKAVVSFSHFENKYVLSKEAAGHFSSYAYNHPLVSLFILRERERDPQISLLKNFAINNNSSICFQVRKQIHFHPQLINFPTIAFLVPQKLYTILDQYTCSVHNYQTHKQSIELISDNRGIGKKERNRY